MMIEALVDELVGGDLKLVLPKSKKDKIGQVLKITINQRFEVNFLDFDASCVFLRLNFNLKPTTVNFKPLLKPFRLGATTWSLANMKSLF